MFAVGEEGKQVWCLDWCLRKRGELQERSARKIEGWSSAYFSKPAICLKVFKK